MYSTTVASEREELLRAYQRVRSVTESLCEPLEPEDMVIQTMPEVSPTKWHLAHVTWFFETLVLQRSGAQYTQFDERFGALFNSYYNSLGDPYPRPRRGILSRPTVSEIFGFRRHVDAAMVDLLEDASDETIERLAPTLTIGLNHEQQHQELLLMDIKHVLAQNPLEPAYRATEPYAPALVPACTLAVVPGREWSAWERLTGDFAFDNERPQHTVLLEPYELASRPVTAGEYRAFIADGGYERPELWLSDGWDFAQCEGWQAPLYWEEQESDWCILTLGGARDVDPTEPVCHVSYYEADAYATWAECRLPSELEWEHAATEGEAASGTFAESAAYHPRPLRDAPGGESLDQLFGDVWEWTRSAYSPYPGFRPFAGKLGEYNGKFMINQMVLRGGCCVTPERHLRPTYRNFYYPHQRWMFGGIRLAR